MPSLQASAQTARPGSRLFMKSAKYFAIGKITARNQLAYLYEMLLRSLFILVILYVLIQLWRVTYEGQSSLAISGFTFQQMVWYLIFAESIVLSCPQMALKIEGEVKSGDIGYQLTRPVSYLLFQYVSYLGEALLRLAITFSVGCCLGVVLFGWPALGWGWPSFLVTAFGSLTLYYILNMIVALCAFWVEETRGIEFVYQKIVFIIGGMMLPPEMMPDAMRTVCSWLPFQSIVYASAKTAVRFDPCSLLSALGIQWLWISLCGALLAYMYRRGVRKLNVNGG